MTISVMCNSMPEAILVHTLGSLEGGGEEQGRGWGCGAGLSVGFWGVFGLGVPKTVLKFLI